MVQLNIAPFFIAFLLSGQVIFAQPSSSDLLESYLQTHRPEVSTTDDGVYYHIDQRGTGSLPKAGDYVSLHFVAKRLDGTPFQSSEPDEPFIFQVGYRQVIRGWDIGIRQFPVGSKGTIFLPARLAYGQRGAGDKVPPNTPLQIDVEVLKILNPSEYDVYMEELEAKERAAFADELNQQFLNDKKLIQEYALRKKWRTKRTDSGLSYYIKKRGKGEPARPGDELTVTYEGFLLDGEPFEKKKGKQQIQFPLGRNKVIKGWEEGLTYFSEGTEGWLLVPSKLAYGPRSIYEENISIPPHSVLVFKIKVEQIIRAEPEEDNP